MNADAMSFVSRRPHRLQMHLYRRAILKLFLSLQEEPSAQSGVLASRRSRLVNDSENGLCQMFYFDDLHLVSEFVSVCMQSHSVYFHSSTLCTYSARNKAF